MDPFVPDPLSADATDPDPFAYDPPPDGVGDHDAGFAPAAAIGDLTGNDLLPGEDEVGTDPDDHLWVHDDGRVWDLGPADVDTDADGVKDSLTRSGPDGLTVYTDSDHDGQVDRITEVGADGSFEARRLDPSSGEWIATDSGRLD